MYEAKNIAFHDITVHEGKGWFYNIGYNAIFQIDLETGELKPEAFLPENELEPRELFAGIVYFDDKLYLAPLKSKRLCIYDLRKKEFSFIDLDNERYGPKGKWLFFRGAAIDNNIYFFPRRFHAIVKLNPADNSLKYIDCWYRELTTKRGEDREQFATFFNVSVENDGWCVLACQKSNMILRLNVLSEEFSIIESGFDGELFDAVGAAGKYIGAFADNPSLYKISDHSTRKIPLEPGNDRDKNIFLDGSNICTISKFGNQICIYDLNTHEKKMLYEFSDVAKDSQKWLSYVKPTTLCNVKIDEHRIVSYSTRSGEILIIDMEKCSVTSMVPVMDDETEKAIDKYLLKLFGESALLLEQPHYGLKDFLGTLDRIL